MRTSRAKKLGLGSLAFLIVVGYGAGGQQTPSRIDFPEGGREFVYGQTLRASLYNLAAPPVEIILEAAPTGTGDWVALVTDLTGSKGVLVEEDDRVGFSRDSDGVFHLSVEWREDDIRGRLPVGTYDLRLQIWTARRGTVPFRAAVVMVRDVKLRYLPTPQEDEDELEEAPVPQLVLQRPDEGGQLSLGGTVVAEVTGLDGRLPTHVSLSAQTDGGEWIPLIAHQGLLEVPVEAEGIEFNRDTGDLQVTWRQHPIVVEGYEYSVEPGPYTIRLSVYVDEPPPAATATQDEVRLDPAPYPVTITRELRAFFRESCEEPVVTLPGLSPSAWVRLHVEIREDLPMLVLQERASGRCAIELSQETRDNADFTIHSLDEHDIGGGKGLCWVLYPTGGVFEAGTTLTVLYSLAVPRGHSPGAVSVAGHWRTICSDMGIRHAPTENTELYVVSQLPMLVALARLDLETLQLKPDGFCAHVEDLDDLLRANYSFCDGDVGRARFEFFQDYIGRMIPGAGELTVDHLLKMAAHRANGEPVVPCFGPIETEEE